MKCLWRVAEEENNVGKKPSHLYHNHVSFKFQSIFGTYLIFLESSCTKYHSTSTLFRNKRFALNEIVQRNASKFAIFNV